MRISVERMLEYDNDARWGVWLYDDDEERAPFVIGVSKHSHDADHAAEKLARSLRAIVDDPSKITVDHHVAERFEQMAKIAAEKKK